MMTDGGHGATSAFAHQFLRPGLPGLFCRRYQRAAPSPANCTLALFAIR
jgi:hypothetical protein